jgi:acyl-CoA synthetase (AMP-forming)/AMP-acid ligase II
MSITQSLHRFAQSRPHAIATRCEDRTRTFAELEDRVARLASGLRRLGVNRGDRVALISLNSDRFLESLLALSWAGATFVPLNFRLNVEELASAINDAGAMTLIVDETFLPLAEPLRSKCPDVRQVVVAGEGDAAAARLEDLIAQSPPMDDIFCAGGDVAGIFYTGGTTGRSKGVMLTHRNLLTSALGTLASGPFFSTTGTALHVAPLFHLAGIWPWLSQLVIGGRHVVLGGFDPAKVAAAVDEHQVTTLLLVPTMVHQLAEHLGGVTARLATLRYLLYAGSPMPEAVVEKVAALLPHVGLIQCYGMTELSPLATLLLPEEHTVARRRSAGRAAPHALVKIADADDREVPRGEVGQILVRGEHVMCGYWRQPELTASTLAGGWMHTGDLGSMDEEGFVEVRDRLKDMIISGGENVYSAEVENVIARHPAVVSCAVIGVPDGEWGERVHAVVVVRSGAELALEELREHVGGRIARYKAPRSLEIATSLPLSSAGKVLKNELRARHAAVQKA